MSGIVAFLEGEGCDAAERNIEVVQSFGLGALERHHDFIQWLFPLAEPSAAVPGSPVLTASDIAAIKASPRAQANLASSTALMTRFYEQTDHWLRGPDHNHLRITRIIKSLRLLTGDVAANRFRSAILARVEAARAPIETATRRYWADA